MTRPIRPPGSSRRGPRPLRRGRPGRSTAPRAHRTPPPSPVAAHPATRSSARSSTTRADEPACPTRPSWPAWAAATRPRSPSCSEGERVLDLGSGGGIDVLLSARRVGPTGRAYRPRHDRRDARAGPSATPPRPASTNVEFVRGHDRGDPAPRRVGRRRHQQLRHQPGRRQGRRLRRDRPRPAARRPGRRQRRRRRRRPVADERAERGTFAAASPARCRSPSTGPAWRPSAWPTSDHPTHAVADGLYGAIVATSRSRHRPPDPSVDAGPAKVLPGRGRWLRRGVEGALGVPGSVGGRRPADGRCPYSKRPPSIPAGVASRQSDVDPPATPSEGRCPNDSIAAYYVISPRIARPAPQGRVRGPVAPRACPPAIAAVLSKRVRTDARPPRSAVLDRARSRRRVQPIADAASSASSALTGNGSAIGSVASRLRPSASKRSRPRSVDVDDVGRAVEREVRGDRATRRAPHHPVAAGRGDRDALDARSRRRSGRAEDRQVVGRVVDGRRPDLAGGPRPRGDRDEAGQPLAHRSYIGQSIARASPGGSSGSLQPNSRPPSSRRQYRPAPMSKTIGMALDGERRVRLEDGDRVARRAGRDPQAGQPPDRRAAPGRRSGAPARWRSGRRSSRPR